MGFRQSKIILAVGVVCALALFAGCLGGKPAPATTPEPPVSVEPVVPPGPTPEQTSEIEDLYARLGAANAQYDEGLGLIVAGDEIAGETLLAEAATTLSLGAAECDRLEFCDIDRFLRTFDSLLSQQGIASRAYTPGPYAELESMIAAWDRHYLEVLGAEE